MSTAICQPEIATATRRAKLSKTWTSKEWKAKRAEFIKNRGGKCEWCNETKYLTVHHPYRNVYGKEAYNDFTLSECVLLCRACHTATHNGMALCDYKEGVFHQDGNKHYRYHDAEMCSFCFKKVHPEIEIARKQAKNDLKKRAKDARKREAERAKQWKKDHPPVVKVKK